jgi:hypothetical protein
MVWVWEVEGKTVWISNLGGMFENLYASPRDGYILEGGSRRADSM